MMKKYILLLLLLAIMMLPTLSFAQDESCPELATTAFQTMVSSCRLAGRNQVCYGNGLVEATFTENPSDTEFDKPGDVADVFQLESLRLHPMDTQAGTWGISLMNLQANLPDTVPGQAVTFLLFGDVEVQTEIINLSTMQEETQGHQAYYFRTGVGDAPCTEAPHSGILIQTREGIGEINVTLNDVDISLGSVAFVQAVPGEDMRVNVLEGLARVSAFGEEQIALPNLRVRIPIDENLRASGAPLPPEPCDVNDLQGIPNISAESNCSFVGIIPFHYPNASLSVPSDIDLFISHAQGGITEAQANRSAEANAITIQIDGQTVPTESWVFLGETNGWHHEEIYFSDLPPGVYTATTISEAGTFSVTITILEPTE